MKIGYLEQDNGHTVLECILYFKIHKVIEVTTLDGSYKKTTSPKWNFEKCSYRPVEDKTKCPLCEGALRSYHVTGGETNQVCAKRCNGYAVVHSFERKHNRG